MAGRAGRSAGAAASAAVDERYREYFRDPAAVGPPGRVTLEVSSRCNLACSMCPRHYLLEQGSFSQGDMSFDLFRALIDQMAGFPARTLVPFFRGEPLLNPLFPEMAAYAKSRGVGPIQLATNAMLLTPALSARLIDLGLDFISFSLDAQGKEAYERIRRGASHDQVLGNIETFLRLRRERGPGGPRVQVSAVRTAGNEALLPAFVAAWKGRVDRVRIYPEHSAGGKFGHLEGGTGVGPRRPCLKLLTDLVIYWDGAVGLCNHDWAGTLGLGDASGQSLLDIWRGPAYHRLRREHWENAIPESSPCFHCDHWRVAYAEGNLIGELYE